MTIDKIRRGYARLLWCFLFFYSVSTVYGKDHQTKRIRHVTDPLGWTYAVELDLYRSNQYLDALIEYAFEDWLIGVEVFNVLLTGQPTQPITNDIYGIINKSWDLTEEWQLLTGGQWGTTWYRPHNLHTSMFLGVEYAMTSTLAIHGGGYYVSDALALTHEPFNYWAGCEWKALLGKVHLQVDAYGGYNNLSGIQTTILWWPYYPVYAYTGVMLSPTPNGNDLYVAIGLAVR